MAIILAIETATEICSVAIGKDGLRLAEKHILAPNMHASHLHILIGEILQETGIEFAELEAIAVSKGPGSYTGLRVGAAAAKGLCYSLSIPLLAINSLESMAAKYIQDKELDSSEQLIPMIDARRNEVYCAVFNPNLFYLEPTQAKILDRESFKSLRTKNIRIFGSGAKKAPALLSLDNASYDLDFFPSADGMLVKADQLFEQKQYEDIAYFEPYYLKEFVGTTPKPLITK